MLPMFRSGQRRTVEGETARNKAAYDALKDALHELMKERNGAHAKGGGESNGEAKSWIEK